MDEYQNSIHDILAAMRTFGGAFVKQLAILYRYGDAPNQAILARSFAQYFLKYDQLATQHKAEMEKK